MLCGFKSFASPAAKCPTLLMRASTCQHPFHASTQNIPPPQDLKLPPSPPAPLQHLSLPNPYDPSAHKPPKPPPNDPSTTSTCTLHPTCHQHPASPYHLIPPPPIHLTPLRVFSPTASPNKRVSTPHVPHPPRVSTPRVPRPTCSHPLRVPTPHVSSPLTFPHPSRVSTPHVCLHPKASPPPPSSPPPAHQVERRFQPHPEHRTHIRGHGFHLRVNLGLGFVETGGDWQAAFVPPANKVPLWVLDGRHGGLVGDDQAARCSQAADLGQRLRWGCGVGGLGGAVSGVQA